MILAHLATLRAKLRALFASRDIPLADQLEITVALDNVDAAARQTAPLRKLALVRKPPGGAA